MVTSQVQRYVDAGRTLVCTLAVLLLGSTPPVSAQLAPPNEAGVSMGHLHYHVRDVAANERFWVSLGGEASRFGETTVVKFPDVLVFLTEGESSGGTEGSVVNHMAFRVRSLDDVEAAGFEFTRSASGSGVTSIYTPEGERIELFDNSATNLTFTLDEGVDDPRANRHNEPIAVPIIAHHIHLYLPAGAEEDEAQAWYAEMFGGSPGMRWRYTATDLPGINFNFSARDEATVPTRGRMLDHVGFEVVNLEAFCRTLETKGVVFDVPYRTGAQGIGSAFLTDPWGTYIELTEGLRGFY